VDAANDLLRELRATARSDIPKIDPPAETTVAPADSLANRPLDVESFHLGMRLFPLGAKLKTLIAR
jgi:hypothetical protein